MCRPVHQSVFSLFLDRFLFCFVLFLVRPVNSSRYWRIGNAFRGGTTALPLCSAEKDAAAVVVAVVVVVVVVVAVAVAVAVV